MSNALEHPLASAIKPLLEAVGATQVELDQARPDDVVLEWEGVPAVAVRLPHLSSALDRLLAEMTRQFDGRALADLDRWEKQRVVALLEERGAFTVRHGVETVASALGVSRFTVYNYLNRQQDDTRTS
ncbi:helix-turn-helix domain-containing protein [Kitasatospora sp. GP82]|uniref:helix-turn-helix domain-containing protein n=1 Tax=Kitasatospora sp. GP82 TaxID=3035089 RepID=UPI0024730F78|nr:helix-turn-helix domain-containing protein [Kitasatospora sp. GP82]MDH6128449.1 CRP-like cAMP-binding protein [Kitasatospora sp. GP82]